jgi:histo-blood group ABO system transferase
MSKKIVLNLIATNKYINFLDVVCPTIEKFFFLGSEITVLVHTNLDLPEGIQNYSRIKFIKNPIEHENWPFTTLKRFHYFLSSREILNNHDYCFYVDVDSEFIKIISEEILPTSGMIGTIHPCLFNGPGTPDRNPKCLAYIPKGSNNRYFCGGFFGGSTPEFIQMSEKIKSNIDSDLSNGVIAVWHDESHLNRYFFDNPPEIVLDHPFAVAENLTHPQTGSGVLFLDKSTRGGHDFFRT